MPLLFFAVSILIAAEPGAEKKLAEKVFGKGELKETAFKKRPYLAAYDKEGTLQGYLVPAGVKGYAGEIKLVIALDPEALFLDYMVIEAKNSEKIKELEKADFSAKCKGKSSSELKLTVFDPRNGKVDAVTGATRTSAAVISSFKDAALFIEELIDADITGANAAGIITITYKRSSDGKRVSKDGTYLLGYRTAVWIEDSKGKLIRTLYRSVGGKINPFPAHLVNWENKSGKISDNTPDTYTGATVQGGKAETSYVFTWDCKDEKGRLVPDGKYKYFVEAALYWRNRGASGAQSSLNSGEIEKGKKMNISTGTLDASGPAVLSSLGAKFEPTETKK